MKRILPISIILVLINVNLFSQVPWQKSYSLQTSFTSGILELSSGTLMIGANNSLPHLIKISKNGDSLWSKKFTDKHNAMIRDFDGNIVITGLSQTPYINGFYMLKVDTLGNVIWERKFNIKCEGFSICQASDSTYLIAGKYIQNQDVFVAKMKKNGDSLWTKKINGLGDEEGKSIANTSDGGFIVTGSTNSAGAGNYDVFLVKFDPTGLISWSKTFGGSSEDRGTVVAELSTGGFFVAGSTKSFGAGFEDFYIIKTTSNGTKIWTKTFGSTLSDFVSSMVYLSGDQAVIGGSTTKTGSSKFYALKIDSAGTKGWEKIYSPGNGSACYSSFKTYDNGYMFAGAGGSSTLHIIKTDNLGCSAKKPVLILEGSKSNKTFTFCSGDPVVLRNTEGFSSYNWSTSSTASFISLPNSSGNYSLTVTDINGCSATSPIVNVDMFLKPAFVISYGGKNKFCPGTFDSLILTAPAGYTKYIWRNDTTKKVNTFMAKKLTSYNVMVTDSNNCSDSASNPVVLSNYQPYAFEEICLVTVDTQTNRNLIAWERTSGQRTAFYKIYRETTVAGVYKQVGMQPFSKTSVFIDNTSNPKQRSYRYYITCVDSCGTESAPSPYHQTLHLTANKGVGNEVNLLWVDPYIGFSFNSYYIYRTSTPGNLTLLDSIQNTFFSYTDNNPPVGAAYYQVSAVKFDTCRPTNVRAVTTSGPFSQSLSNLKDFNATSNDYLNVSPSEITLNVNTDTTLVSIMTNLNTWTAMVDKTFIDITEDHDNGLLIVAITDNPKPDYRIATITISVSGLPDRHISVWQEGTQTGISQEEKSKFDLNIYPNPTQSISVVNYSTEITDFVSLKIYNSLGVEVADLANEYQNSGEHTYQFSAIEAGIYFVRLQVGNEISVKSISVY